jgi:uncharacterized protein YndB with AHSA1/START domain
MGSFTRTFDWKAPPERIYGAVATVPGIRAWWTEDCDGDDDQFRVRFGQTAKAFRVERRPGEVRWTCTAAHIAVERLTRRDEWVGTTIVFTIRELPDGSTRLDFVHEGLGEALECYDLCVAGWDTFLGSLGAFVEAGRGTPQAVAA